MQRANYRALEANHVPEGTGIQQPATYLSVTVESPAISVMTDLRLVSAATVEPGTSLSEATRIMIARGVRLLLVQERPGELAGLITARDTGGERPVQYAVERGLKFADLRVADLMVPRSAIEVLRLPDVLRAEVGHILATLKAQGRQHAIVVEHDPGGAAPRVRGIFSATQIGRQLGVAVQTFEVATTFAEIERALFD